MSNDSWATQDDLYQVLHDEFNFDFDLCASKENTKCKNWSEDAADFAVTTEARKYNSYWCNPPYSAGNISICMGAVTYVNGEGKNIVTLTRFDPSAVWFKQCVDGVAAEVRMLDRRPKFKGAKDSYPFPCCVAVYRGYTVNKTNYYSWGWK